MKNERQVFWKIQPTQKGNRPDGAENQQKQSVQSADSFLIVFFYVEKIFTGLALLAIPPKLILSYSKVERSDSVWLLSLEG